MCCSAYTLKGYAQIIYSQKQSPLNLIINSNYQKDRIKIWPKYYQWQKNIFTSPLFPNSLRDFVVKQFIHICLLLKIQYKPSIENDTEN